LRTQIGLWVQWVVRMPVAGQATLKAQNIGVIRASDDHGSAGSHIEKADTVEDSRLA
jgi:hypothetical protein